MGRVRLGHANDNILITPLKNPTRRVGGTKPEALVIIVWDVLNVLISTPSKGVVAIFTTTTTKYISFCKRASG